MIPLFMKMLALFFSSSALSRSPADYRRDEISYFGNGVFITFENYQCGRDAFNFLESLEILPFQEADRTGNRLKCPLTSSIISDAKSRIMVKLWMVSPRLPTGLNEDTE